MGQRFTVQLLNDKEFDGLNYRNISDSLGIADVKKGLVFVRRTGIKDFDEATLHHEIDHMVEEHATDEDEYGIRHKKGGALRNIVPYIVGAIFGPVAGAATNIGMDQYAKSNHPEQLGKTGKFGDILGAGAQGYIGSVGAGNALTGGIAGGTAAAPGFLSKAGGILSGAALGTAPSATASGSTGLIGSGGKLLGIGAGSLAPTSLATSPALSALSSSVPAAGEAAARAATTGLQFSATPQVGLNLLGQVGATNALNSSATANNPAMSLASGGVGNSAGQSLNASTPAMSLPNGGIGNATGTQLTPPMTSAMPGLGAGNTTAGLGTSAGSAIAPATSAVTQPATQAAKSAFSFKDLVTPSNVLGGGALLGALGQQTPQFQMPDSVEELRQKILSGNSLSPLGQQAQGELSNILNSSPQELYAPANDAYYAETNRTIDKQYTQAKSQLDAAYNNAGQLGSGEYMDQLRKLNEAQANAKDAFAQTENQRRFELARTDKYKAIQDSLGVDKSTMDNLIGLTGMDVNMAASAYGVKANDVTEIRKLLGTLGTNALFPPQQVSLLGGNNANASQSIMNTPLLK